MQTMGHGTLSTIIATMKLKVTDKECNGTLGKHISLRDTGHIMVREKKH